MALRERLHASHEPATRWPGGVVVAFDAGPSQTLPRRQRRRGANRGAVWCREVWGRPAFGRVNTS